MYKSGKFTHAPESLEAFLEPPLHSGTKAQYPGVVSYDQTENKNIKSYIIL